MGVTCQILLTKTKDGVYRSGQPVLGSVRYNLDKPTEFDSITVSLIGLGKCQWSETDSDDNTTYYENKEQYVSQAEDILSSQKPYHPTGTYECPFNFMLPESIPSSIKTRNCNIGYKIYVKFVKANFLGTSKNYDADIPVYGSVDPCSPEPLIFGLKKELFSITSKPTVNIKAEIERTFVTPGENIKLTLWINNNANIPVTSVKTELIKHFTCVSKGKQKSIHHKTVDTTARSTPSIPENTEVVYTCIVPTLPSLYSIQHTKILIGDYKVRVTAVFPFPHTNAFVEVPVVIGEREDLHGAKLADESSSSKFIQEAVPGSDNDIEN